MIAAPPDALGARADALVAALPAGAGARRGRRAALDGRRRVAARRDAAVVGRARSPALGRTGCSPALRRGDAGGRRPDRGRRVVLDLRTVEPADDAAARRRSPRRLRPGAEPMTVVVGTAGHIDHGKTTLLRALTGIDADRLPEERRRGMTIDVGYAHLALPDGTELDFVDVPGHDRLVGNMLVGAGEIDAALLVVAADDGPRAQTLEHLALLDALGIRRRARGRDQGRPRRPRADRPRSSTRRRATARVGTSLAGVAGRWRVSATTGDGDRRRCAPRSSALRDRVLADRGRREPARPAAPRRSTGSSRSRAAASS